MKNRRLLPVVLALMLLPFVGCQLADPSDGSVTGQDRLCGIFITTEPLDFSSDEEEINIVPSWDGLNAVAVNPQDSRIYATRHDITTNGHKNWDFTFDGLEGVRLLEPSVMYNDEEYRPSIFDNEIDGIFTNISNDALSITGTIYTDIHYPLIIYTNPVYQTPEGEVYVTNGQGMLINSVGSIASTKLTGATSETVNGVTSQKSMELELKIEAINTIDKIILKQMNDNNEMIVQIDITKEHIPESVSIMPDTAYIIMEQHSVDGSDKAVVDRSILKTDDNFFTARFTGDKGLIQLYRVSLTHK